jgi:hypothetical protein
MSDSDERKPKIGEGHAGAMGRLGLHELRAAAYPGSNIAQHSEYGLYGTRTPGEVAEARRGDERDLEEETSNGSVLDDRMRQAEMNRDAQENRGEDRDRELER